MIHAVIGCNYGDEGKGLVTDYLSSKSASTLVIRHNGGAQSGHTVELQNKRFIFHELSSGSFRKADTFWAKTYYPDLYKLWEELEDFEKLAGFMPRILADESTNITTIDDVLINMLREAARGDSRHGSCGMGINEADLRTKAGYGITLKEVKDLGKDGLFKLLKKIRNEVSIPLIKEILEGLDAFTETSKENAVDSIGEVSSVSEESVERLDDNFNPSEIDEYLILLNDDNVLLNFVEEAINNLKYIEIISDVPTLLKQYENVVFETGQGLKLDAEYEANWPHVTASRTGLHNIINLLNEYNLHLDEVDYVTRTYVTKHGAGPLPLEDASIRDRYSINDETNINNPWQGSIRYAYFEDKDSLINEIKNDLNSCDYKINTAVFITHVNETEGKILINGEMDVRDYIPYLKSHGIDSIYTSGSRFAEDISID